MECWPSPLRAAPCTPQQSTHGSMPMEQYPTTWSWLPKDWLHLILKRVRSCCPAPDQHAADKPCVTGARVSRWSSCNDRGICFMHTSFLAGCCWSVARPKPATLQSGVLVILSSVADWTLSFGNWQTVTIDEEGNPWAFTEYVNGAHNSPPNPVKRGWSNWGIRVFKVNPSD